MKKIDYRNEYKEIYQPKKGKINFLDIPEMNFLIVDGKGTPKEQMFQDAAQTIYTIAYTIKFMIREEIGIDYHVMPMEVVWDLDRKNKKFKWQMMIMQPEYVTQKHYEKALEEIERKGKLIPMKSATKFSKFPRGRYVQKLHVGPYEKMNDTLKEMKDFAEERGYSTENDTHDIYLNDVRKTKKENLKTIMLVRAREK